jgi:hypothetical protein
VIVVNASFPRVLWADVLCASDLAFWLHYGPGIRETFAGELWSVNERARDLYGVHWVKGSIDHSRVAPGALGCGKTSGEAAIGFARHFGAVRGVLLGYDCKRQGARTHWHADHPQALGNGGDMAAWAGSMTALARNAAAAGFEVLNATRDTALDCFRRVPLEEALR